MTEQRPEKTEWGLGRLLFLDACVDLSTGSIPAWKIFSAGLLAALLLLVLR